MKFLLDEQRIPAAATGPRPPPLRPRFHRLRAIRSQGRRQSARGGNYANIAKLIANDHWTRIWDDETKVPWLKSPEGKQVIGYDDAESLTIKTKWAMDHHLRGVFFWEVRGDLLEDGSHPLQQAAHNAEFGGCKVARTLWASRGVPAPGELPETCPLLYHWGFGPLIPLPRREGLGEGLPRHRQTTTTANPPKNQPSFPLQPPVSSLQPYVQRGPPARHPESPAGNPRPLGARRHVSKIRRIAPAASRHDEKRQARRPRPRSRLLRRPAVSHRRPPPRHGPCLGHQGLHRPLPHHARQSRPARLGLGLPRSAHRNGRRENARHRQQERHRRQDRRRRVQRRVQDRLSTTATTPGGSTSARWPAGSTTTTPTAPWTSSSWRACSGRSRECYKKDLIYRDYRVTPYCTRCETSLSISDTRESDATRPRQDPSVVVRFKLLGRRRSQASSAKPTYALVWTTTPWTLPSNLALAVNPEIDYAVVETDDAAYVLAAALVGKHAAILWRRSQARESRPRRQARRRRLRAAAAVLRRPQGCGQHLPHPRSRFRRRRRRHRHRPPRPRVRRRRLHRLQSQRRPAGQPCRRIRAATPPKSPTSPVATCSKPTATSSAAQTAWACSWSNRSSSTTIPTAGAAASRSSTARWTRGISSSRRSKTTCCASTTRSTGSLKR